jgi:glycosyltransferase involved in cell wall biosynthesis
VASALAQTYPNIEIIIVDDHSTDGLTKTVLQELCGSGIRSLLTPEGKKGLPAARNAGIAVASGTYILPLDAEDVIDPTYVEKAAAILDAKPEVGICYCKARLFGLKRGPWNLPPYSWEEMLVRNTIFATALFRKADWERVGGYDESLVRGLEDYAFWLRVIALGRDVVRLEEELFNYRIKPNSLLASMASAEQSWLAADDVFRSCEPIFRDNAHILFSRLQRMKKEQGTLSCLLWWKLLQPVFSLEWAVRQFIKKVIGRA